MRLKPYLCVVFLSSMALPVQAGQPIYVSMAECSGMMLGLLRYVETPDRKAFILDTATLWAEAAEKEAGRDMSAVVAEKAETWFQKGRGIVFSQEHCAALRN